MDNDVHAKIQSLYEAHIKHDPIFITAFNNIISEGRSFDGHQRTLGTPGFTAEAEQGQDKAVEKVKPRTIEDILIHPKDKNEETIASAAKSGLMTQSELRDVGSKEANTSNVNKFVEQLADRARFVNQITDSLDHEFKKKVVADSNHERDVSADKIGKQAEAEKDKNKETFSLGKETSALGELTEKMREKTDLTKMGKIDLDVQSANQSPELKKAVESVTVAFQHAQAKENFGGQDQKPPMPKELADEKGKQFVRDPKKGS